MSKLTHKQLKKAAAEISDVFGLEPAIDLTGDETALTALLKEALELKTDEDVFTPATQAVIDALEIEDIPEDDEVVEPIVEEDEEPDPPAKTVKAERSTKKQTTIVEPDPPIPPKSVIEEEESEYTELIEEINEASKIVELKDIAMENREFKGIRKKLDMYKKASDLRAEMLQILEDLDGAEEDMKPETEKPMGVKFSKATGETIPVEPMEIPKEKKSNKAGKAAKELVEAVDDEIEEVETPVKVSKNALTNPDPKSKKERQYTRTGPRKRDSIFADAIELMGKNPFMDLDTLYATIAQTGTNPKKNNGVRSAYLMMKRCVEALDKNGLINKKK